MHHYFRVNYYSIRSNYEERIQGLFSYYFSLKIILHFIILKNESRERNAGSEVISFYFPSFFHFQLVLMIFLNGKYHSPITLLRSNSYLLGKLIVLNFSRVVMKNIRKMKFYYYIKYV